MKIGYVRGAYPERRCVVHQVKKNEYIMYAGGGVQPCKLTKLVRRIKNGVLYRLGLLKPDWNASAVVKESKLVISEKVDVVHLFNSVYQGRQRWCTTFESQTPVTNDLLGRPWEHEAVVDGTYPIERFSRKMLKLCAKDNCLALIALSNSAYQIEMEQMRKVRLSEKQRKTIMDKVICVHPPQPVLIRDVEMQNKFEDVSEIKFIIVGHDFFRKGGAEIIDTLTEFYRKRYRFTLTIVSKLYPGDYSCMMSQEEYDAYRTLIYNTEWIQHYDILPNEDVVGLMKASHIGLLPSKCETYGYSVLEYQACGCSCITTDIRALAEINTETCGWVCHIPHNEFGEAIYGCDGIERKLEVADTLRAELKRVFTEVFDNREQIAPKGYASLQRIKKEHSPEMYAQTLQKIYSGERITTNGTTIRN